MSKSIITFKDLIFKVWNYKSKILIQKKERRKKLQIVLRDNKSKLI